MSDDNDKAFQDMLVYGTGVTMDGAHVPYDQYFITAADEIERLRARLAEVDEKIENARQAMSETQPSWEYRCHAIMAALGCNYGGPTPDIPEEHTWYARNLKLNKDRAERLEAALRQIAAMDEVSVTDFDKDAGWNFQVVARAALHPATKEPQG